MYLCIMKGPILDTHLCIAVRAIGMHLHILYICLFHELNRSRHFVVCMVACLEQFHNLIHHSFLHEYVFRVTLLLSGLV